MLEDGIKFLETIFHEGDLVSLRPIKPQIDHHGLVQGEWCKTFTREELIDGELKNYLSFCSKAGANPFFGVCPRHDRAPKDTSYDKAWQIRRVNTFWIDIDHITPKEAEERLTKAQARGLPEPTVILSTGNGVHCYWVLEEPFILDVHPLTPPILNTGWDGDKKRFEYFKNEEGDRVYVKIGGRAKRTGTPDLCPDALMIEDINNGIGVLVGGDNCSDIARIFRLPGLNMKNTLDGGLPTTCKIHRVTDKYYQISDFDEILKISPTRIKREEASQMAIPEGTATKLGKRQQKEFNKLLNACAIALDGERSDRDFEVLCWAVNQGIEPEFLWSQVQDKSKFAERGRQYFDTSYQNARLQIQMDEYEQLKKKYDAEHGIDDLFESEDEGEEEIITQWVISDKLKETTEGQLVYCNDDDRWWRYNAGRYEVAAPKDWQNLVKNIVQDTAKQIEDAEQRLDFREKWETNATLDSVMRCSRGQDGMNSMLENFDSHPLLFNVQNGTIELGRECKFREHRPIDRCTRMAGVNYDPDFEADEWKDFVKQISVHPVTREPSLELYQFHQTLVGYALSGEVHEHILPIFYGSGGNGKGAFIRTIAALFGDYCVQPSADIFLQSRSNSAGPRSDIMALRGARFVAAQEMSADRACDEALIKKITGGDRMSARELRGKQVEFDPSWLVVLATNDKPDIKGADEGIWRRLKLIPFMYKIREVDHGLEDRLLKELPGILNWMLEGYERYCREGLIIPDIVRQATTEYRGESDVVEAFLTDCCVREEGARVEVGELYEAYSDYCSEMGEEMMTKKWLGNRLEQKGLPGHRDKKNRYRVGVRLKEGSEIDQFE